MRAAALVSLLLHALALGVVLARLPPPPPPPVEAPAQIEVIFGRNARAQGAPATAPPAAVTAPQAASAAPLPPAPMALPTSPPRAQVALVAAPAAAANVRLGDGLVGFDVRDPDAGMVPARADPGNRPPPYPEAAWQRREHGTVVLRIHVRPDGLVGLVETLQSSGSDALDAAAITAARGWRFVPQMREGVPVASVRDQAMHFVLE